MGFFYRTVLLLAFTLPSFYAKGQEVPAQLVPVIVPAQLVPVIMPAVEPSPAPKDTTYWKKGMMLGANLTQATFSKNWKSGGTNNLSFSLLAQARAEYIRGQISWRSEMDFQYGSVRNQGQGYRKSLDKLYLDSKVGHKLATHWDLFASLNLFSQFAQGFTYSTDPVTNAIMAKYVSAFMAPGYITESAGVEYKPITYFFLRIGAATLRQTLVRDTTLHRQEPTNYGVPVGRRVRNEVALQIVASFEKDVAPNINLKTRYTGFYNYTTLADPQQWDHRLETGIVARVNKYISTSIMGLMIFDRDADTDVQVSYQLGLGFLATLGNFDKK